MTLPESAVPVEFVDETRERLRALVRVHLVGARVVFFGSRALGAGNRYSDFDVAYLPREGFDPLSVVRLRETIEESDIIYDVDLVDLSAVDAPFREKVLREGTVWRS